MPVLWISLSNVITTVYYYIINTKQPLMYEDTPDTDHLRGAILKKNNVEDLVKANFV